MVTVLGKGVRIKQNTKANQRGKVPSSSKHQPLGQSGTPLSTEELVFRQIDEQTDSERERYLYEMSSDEWKIFERYRVWKFNEEFRREAARVSQMSPERFQEYVLEESAKVNALLKASAQTIKATTEQADDIPVILSAPKGTVFRDNLGRVFRLGGQCPVCPYESARWAKEWNGEAWEVSTEIGWDKRAQAIVDYDSKRTIEHPIIILDPSEFKENKPAKHLMVV